MREGQPMRLSIVIPALDEAPRIVAALEALQPLRAQGHEVIVVDGGSTDGTLELARPLADRAFASAPGRARQMNAGAKAATGETLLFLHADSTLPTEAARAVAEALDGGRRWGRFDVTLSGRARTLMLVAAMMNVRSRWTGIATGDQGLFVERALFEDIGGFPDIPLMEDIALSKALKRKTGRPAALRSRVVASGRRWERHGPWKTILAMWRLRLEYALGADPAALARRYDF
jgi:rSAM/selenodomain-associated transferase 2